MPTAYEIKARIIRKLVRWRKWGASHTENVLSGLPRHIRGAKETRAALDELVRSGWIIPAKKTGEMHYSLNPEMADEIMQFYEEYARLAHFLL